jgi:hypothetical protein
MIMIEGLEQLYQQIADEIVASITEPWSSVKLVAIFFSDSIAFETEYMKNAGGLNSFEVSLDCIRALIHLRRKFKEAGQPVWGEAIFELHADGKFNMKWGYENCDENGDTVMSDEDWLKRHDEHRLRILG